KQITTRLEQSRSRCEDLVQSIQDAVPLSECPSGVSVEQFIATELALLDDRAREAGRLQEKLNRLEIERQVASSDLNAAVQALSNLEQMEAGLRRDIGEAHDRVREIDTQIQLAGTPDPERDGFQIQEQIGAIERRLREETESYGIA